MISTECEKCIHNEVCGLKTCVKEAEAKANENRLGCIHPDVEVFIKCRKFKESGRMTNLNRLSRAELIDKICFTDAVSDCGQVGCSSSCDKCEEVLNYLLDRYDEQIRADEREKVLDEVIKVLAKDEDTILSDKQYYTLKELRNEHSS